MDNLKHIALIGQPNSGKTTLFNALTGANQQVGNWPGVTVEKKSGFFMSDHENNGLDMKYELCDLPGIQALLPDITQASLDEKVTTHYLLNEKIDCIINVVDATQLVRHLYLTLQLMHLGIPIIIVLSFADVAAQQSLQINIAAFSQALHCPVLTIDHHGQAGIAALKKQLAVLPSQEKPIIPAIYPQALVEASTLLTTAWLPQLKTRAQAWAWYALEMGLLPENLCDQQTYLLQQREPLAKMFEEDLDIICAEARYQWLALQVKKWVVIPEKNNNISVLDQYLMHRWLGVPLFLMAMFLLFFTAIQVGGVFQDFFAMTSHAIFVDGMQTVLINFHFPMIIIKLLTQGVGLGLETTLTFIPVLAVLFFLLSFLEDCGYMARAAIIIDRALQQLHLPGKAFIPLLIGFGCNVPAVMAARTLSYERDRILTILMTPFMSCGARLAIFSVFAAAFFPHHAGTVVFSLYLVGIFAALFSGWLFRKILLPGGYSPLLMELPRYQWPPLSQLFRSMWERLSGFIWRAGRLIIPLCLLLGALNQISLPNTASPKPITLLEKISQQFTPLLRPMGIAENNWQATVGLITGVLAKEVVVATLNTLYSPQQPETVMATPFMTQIKSAFQSILLRFQALRDAIIHPSIAASPAQSFSPGVTERLQQQFVSPLAAYAYLLFIVLYVPCVSTVAVIARELNFRWALFSVMWSTGMAYTVSVIFWQIAKKLN